MLSSLTFSLLNSRTDSLGSSAPAHAPTPLTFSLTQHPPARFPFFNAGQGGPVRKCSAQQAEGCPGEGREGEITTPPAARRRPNEAAGVHGEALGGESSGLAQVTQVRQGFIAILKCRL